MTRKSLSVAALALAGMAAGAVQAQVAVRDAETGELRAPTAAEAAALRSAAPAAAAATAGVQRAVPAGGVALTLDDSHMVYSVARVNAKGVVERECVDGSEAAVKAMQKRPAFAKPMSLATTTRGAAYELK